MGNHPPVFSRTTLSGACLLVRCLLDRETCSKGNQYAGRVCVCTRVWQTSDFASPPLVGNDLFADRGGEAPISPPNFRSIFQETGSCDFNDFLLYSWRLFFDHLLFKQISRNLLSNELSNSYYFHGIAPFTRKIPRINEFESLPFFHWIGDEMLRFSEKSLSWFH